MKLASINDGTPDGRLVVVSQDLTMMVEAAAATTLQQALERWPEVAPQLVQIYSALNRGAAADAVSFDQTGALAPLPRAWQFLDGSAFASHATLMAQAFNMTPLPFDVPLMYQGLSDHFYPGHADVPMTSIGHGIDFEGEFGVLCTAVPAGADLAVARNSIALLVQINDWSLRQLAPAEMARQFGFVQCKPASGIAPVAVTPDELGTHWRDCRVALPLTVLLNGGEFGRASGAAMAFGFDELIAHAAYTRDLPAGTIIGSGTVSDADIETVGCSCIAERRAWEKATAGAVSTPYLRFGDTVTMTVHTPEGASVFGEIEQTVVRRK